MKRLYSDFIRLFKEGDKLEVSARFRKKHNLKKDDVITFSHYNDYMDIVHLNVHKYNYKIGCELSYFYNYIKLQEDINYTPNKTNNMSDTFAITKEQVHELCKEFPEIIDKMKSIYPTMFEETYRRGDKFMRQGEIYILAQMDYKKSFSLISLEDGNRWSNPIVVENVFEVTHSEFVKLIGGEFDNEFKLVK